MSQIFKKKKKNFNVQQKGMENSKTGTYQNYDFSSLAVGKSPNFRYC